MNNTVLLTGGAGFIGSHLLAAYVNNGYNVLVVDNFSSGSMKNIEEMINDKVLVFNIDIRDYDALEEVFKKYTPAIVNHHAAQKSVPYSVDNPIEDININIIGALNLMLLSGKYNVKNFISISSGGALSKEIHGNEKSKESDIPQLISPYAISKYADEKLLDIYSKKMGYDYTILRYANVYGPRQVADGECGVIPIFVNNILDGKKSILMTYNDMPKGCTRDYVYISDIVKANMIVTKKAVNTVINIGSGIELSIKDIYDVIVEEFGATYDLEICGPRKGDIRRSVLDSTKARELIGWEPEVSLKEGIADLKKYITSHN